MNTLVVNCSAPYYNLGAEKLRNWLAADGHAITYQQGDGGMFATGFDAVYLSVIFSWHALIARDIALRYADRSQISCGGPGMFALRKWWKEQTGLECHPAVDVRFENQAGEYRMTFASRGCPVDCYFCIVPRLEGTAFTLNWGFAPAPVLCDNNLSALPDTFQDHIIERYRASGIVLRDANSGFEPRTFTEDTYNRWRGFYKGAWRFAFDTTSEETDVRRMMHILRNESPSRKRVYVLIGNEPIEACRLRAEKVREWGGEPYVQPVMPLNALSRDNLKVAHDWESVRQLRDFQRYYNRWVYRSVPLSEYKPRRYEPSPFSRPPLASAAPPAIGTGTG